MGQEIELKCRFQAEDLTRLLALLTERGEAQPSVRLLENIYFDTSQRDLNRQRMALRLRKVGDRWLQTLKTAGQIEGALTQRGEWEVPVAGAQLELDALPELPLTGGWQAQLAPVFHTDFTRYAWQIDWPLANGRSTRLELAADIGEVRLPAASTTRVQGLAELEFELISGPEEGLFACARYLAQHLVLHPAVASKALRGWWLADASLSPLAQTQWMQLEHLEALQPQPLLQWAGQAVHAWLLGREFAHLSADETAGVLAYRQLLGAQAMLALSQWLAAGSAPYAVRRAVHQLVQAFQPWVLSYWRDQALHRLPLEGRDADWRQQQLGYRQRRTEQRALESSLKLGQWSLQLVQHLSLRSFEAADWTVARSLSANDLLKAARAHLRLPRQPMHAAGWITRYPALVRLGLLLQSLCPEANQDRQRVEAMLEDIGELSGLEQLLVGDFATPVGGQCWARRRQELLLRLGRQAQALGTAVAHV